jgi:hypothetical protein
MEGQAHVKSENACPNPAGATPKVPVTLHSDPATQFEAGIVPAATL